MEGQRQWLQLHWRAGVDRAVTIPAHVLDNYITAGSSPGSLDYSAERHTGFEPYWGTADPARTLRPGGVSSLRARRVRGSPARPGRFAPLEGAGKASAATPENRR